MPASSAISPATRRGDNEGSAGSGAEVNGDHPGTKGYMEGADVDMKGLQCLRTALVGDELTVVETATADADVFHFI